MSETGHIFNLNLDLAPHALMHFRVGRAMAHVRSTLTALASSKSAPKDVSQLIIARGSSQWHQLVAVLLVQRRSLVVQVKAAALPTLTALARGQVARRIVRRLKIALGSKAWLTLAEALRAPPRFLVVQASMRVLPTSTASGHGRSAQLNARKLKIARGHKLSHHLAAVQRAHQDQIV